MIKNSIKLKLKLPDDSLAMGLKDYLTDHVSTFYFLFAGIFFFNFLFLIGYCLYTLKFDM